MKKVARLANNSIVQVFCLEIAIHYHGIQKCCTQLPFLSQRILKRNILKKWHSIALTISTAPKRTFLSETGFFFLTASTRHWRIKLLPVQFGVTVVIVLRGREFYSTLLLNDQQKLTQWKRQKQHYLTRKKSFSPHRLLQGFTDHTWDWLH